MSPAGQNALQPLPAVAAREPASRLEGLKSPDREGGGPDRKKFLGRGAPAAPSGSFGVIAAGQEWATVCVPLLEGALAKLPTGQALPNHALLELFS